MVAKNRKPILILAMVFCGIFIVGILNYTFEAAPAINAADNQFELNIMEDAYPQDWNWSWDGGKQDVARALASDSNNSVIKGRLNVNDPINHHLFLFFSPASLYFFLGHNASGYLPFLLPIILLGPFLVLALVWVLCPLKGRPFRCRNPL